MSSGNSCVSARGSSGFHGVAENCFQAWLVQCEKLALHVISTNIIKAHFRVGTLTEKYHYITNAKEKGGGVGSVLGGF